MPYRSDARPMLRTAYQAGYVLPAFNVCSAEMIRACLEAADEERAPVLLQTYPSDLRQVPPRQAVATVRSFASEVGVPVALHLDHGPDVATALACLRAGFGSVMLDGAHAETDALLRDVQRLAEVAHAQGAALEVAADSFDAGRGDRTDPDDARRLHQAGADMVAVSVGSEHGQASRLDAELLHRIAQAVGGPLVIHGGSGVPEADLRTAREAGVVKLNVGSASYRALRRVWEASADAPNHRVVYERARDALREVARERIRACGAAGRADAT
ncbi:MAG: class II fructose-bisphosphate aldolase [Trueperaceae bacterium]